MQTFHSSSPTPIPSTARFLADLYRLGVVRQAPGFNLSQVAIVGLPGGRSTIWVNSHEFRLLKDSPALTQLVGPNPTSATDVRDAIIKGFNYVRMRRTLSPGTNQAIDDEEHILL